MAELTERIVILMTPELVRQIDQYRVDHRLSSRGDAIRQLAEKALAASETKPDNKKPS